MKKLSLLLLMVFCTVGLALAQRTVTGQIVDDSGEPLIGANVVIKGSTVGTVTDFDGNYSLDVPDDGGILVISYTGYATQELEIGTSNTLDIVLSEGVELGEVVVTAIGLESNKRILGYSVQNVDADDVVNSREVNFIDGLNSKIAGVSVVSSSGSPGASSNIRIRGSSSVTGSNDPLFVIDGVPIDNSEVGNGVGGYDQSNRAIDINPNDIASITILKGAAATSLYGVRAANGAVIITSKQGKAGDPTITISGTYSFDQVNQFPSLQNEYAQGRPLGGVPTWRGPHTAEGFSWGPSISDLEFDGSEYDFDKGGRLVAKGTGNGTPARAYDRENFFVTGGTYDLSASVSGGSNNVNYYISGGRLSQTGVVPNATFERNTFKVSVNADLTDKLSAFLSANYIYSGGDRIQRGSNIKGVMLGLLRTTPTFDNGNGLEGQEAADNPETYIRPNGAQRSYRAGVYDNPYWTANKNPYRDNVNRMIGYAGMRYEILPWLAVQYRLGIDMYTDRRNWAEDINPGRASGEVSQSFISSTDINSDLLLLVNTNFSPDWSFTGTFGHNYFSQQYINQGSDGTTLAAPDFYHISNATDIQSFEVVSARKLIGAYADMNLGFRDYLYFNITARNDWSTTLPAGNNTFQSWSASIGFAITELLEMQNNPIMSYAKLRLSYGSVGNDAPIYATQNYFNPAAASGDGFISAITFPAYGVNAFERDIQLGNNILVPERTTTLEIGGEFKFWNGRIGLDVTYFNSESTDQILPVQLPAPTGFTSAILNAGRITNEGLELMLSVNAVKGDNFRWDIDANFYTYSNIVEELAEGIEDIGLSGFTSTSSDAVAGFPFGVIYGNGFQYDEAGNRLIGTDGFPLQDPTKRPLGDPNPDWTLGLRNSFTFFNSLTLSALLDVRQGGDVWCGTCGIINYFGVSQTSSDQRNDVVVFDGVLADGTPNDIAVPLADPANGLGGNYWIKYGFGGITEMNVYDASWVRLRELTLAYSLPQSVLANSSLENVSFALSARNLWLNTDYPGIDPESNLTGATNGFGLDYFNMPNTKSYSLTVKLVF
jgi:TonB-linked SusC/RagA family outer membrane protein